MPHVRWTEMAPTGSSMRALSMMRTEKTTMTPAIRPMRMDEVMAIWSGGGSLNARVALLTAVGGLLQSNVAVFDDDSIDLITGGAGADLIIADRSLLGDGAIDLVLLQSAQDRLIALN